MSRLLQLPNLQDMHPALLWGDIVAATVAVLGDRGFDQPYRLSLETNNVPRYDTQYLDLHFVAAGVVAESVEGVRRTYEPHRLVELAAIGVAGLALFSAGGHQIRDVALRGTAADYLVDDECHLLEIAGRSQRSDFESCWDARWSRLMQRCGFGFYVCVCEFETLRGRLAFAP
jgi:hypothetical protein